MTPIDRHLADLAEQAGVTTEYRLLPQGRDGDYLHDRQLIRLRPGMSARLHRSVLAHELGHAAFADVPSQFGPVHAKQERRAEEWAALRLVDMDEYRHLEQLHHGHAGAIALDLGVMRSIVLAYQGLLERVGDTLYLQPKMGAGNWLHREEIA